MGESRTLTETGATGLEVSGGRIYEDPLTQLSGDRWKYVLRDMLANDSVVCASLFVIEMLARQVSWTVEPFSDDGDDLENRDFVRDCLFKDMEQTWQDVLSEILTFLPWGWSYFETVYKRRSGFSRNKKTNSRFDDGRIGWRKFAPRAQESLREWQFDASGDITAMVQQPAPDYKTYAIPYERALHFRTAARKNNPEGVSILRGAYRAWYFKTNLENIEGIGIERDLAGLPVAYVPPQILSTSATANEKAFAQQLLNIVKNIRRDESEGILFPMAYDSHGNLQYELKLLSTGGQRQFDTSKIIDRYDQRILMSTLTDFLLLGSKTTGSYALSTDKSEMFTTAIGAFLDSICDVFNRTAIPRLLRLNGKDMTRVPRLAHGDVERVSLEEIGNYIRELSGANIIFDEDEQNELKRKVLKNVKG